jgi:nitrogen regulatory protein P-II 1
MKEIKAIIQPQRLDRLRDAFREMPGFPGMSVSRAEGCGPHEGPETAHGLREELTDFSPKVRIEIIAPDDRVDEIVGLIHTHTHTGRRGDGIIWVTEVLAFRRIKLDDAGAGD